MPAIVRRLRVEKGDQASMALPFISSSAWLYQRESLCPGGGNSWA